MSGPATETTVLMDNTALDAAVDQLVANIDHACAAAEARLADGASAQAAAGQTPLTGGTALGDDAVSQQAVDDALAQQTDAMLAAAALRADATTLRAPSDDQSEKLAITGENPDSSTAGGFPNIVPEAGKSQDLASEILVPPDQSAAASTTVSPELAKQATGDTGEPELVLPASTVPTAQHSLSALDAKLAQTSALLAEDDFTDGTEHLPAAKPEATPEPGELIAPVAAAIAAPAAATKLTVADIAPVTAPTVAKPVSAAAAAVTPSPAAQPTLPKRPSVIVRAFSAISARTLALLEAALRPFLKIVAIRNPKTRQTVAWVACLTMFNAGVIWAYALLKGPPEAPVALGPQPTLAGPVESDASKTIRAAAAKLAVEQSTAHPADAAHGAKADAPAKKADAGGKGH